MKGTTNSAKFFWKAGRGRSAVLPRPRRLEMAIMLSMESMRHHGAWQQKITQPSKSSRAKQILYDSFGSGDGDAREQRLAYLT